MSIVSGIVVYIIIWWTVIFCVLPIGLSTTQETGKEGEYIAPGAPKMVNIKKKFLITTAVAFVIWLIVVGLIQADLIDFREMAATME